MTTASGPLPIDAATTRAALPYDRLVPALRDAFAADVEAPLRHSHDIGGGAALLLMPAWQSGTALGIKIVTVVPGNGARGLPAVSSTYLLCDGETGQHRALIDGAVLTARRTAAVSALAGTFLARPDAETLLIVGSGHVARELAPAWMAVRPLRRVLVWNIRAPGAERLAAALCAEGMNAAADTDLSRAVAAADIVSCATLATSPVVLGAWLRPGTHLDLIGGYRPNMREADDEAVGRSAIAIDTEAALAEAGDLTQPIAAGRLDAGRITTLARLCRGEPPPRAAPGGTTLFKSVGSALEDLAAARLVLETVTATVAA